MLLIGKLPPGLPGQKTRKAASLLRLTRFAGFANENQNIYEGENPPPLWKKTGDFNTTAIFSYRKKHLANRANRAKRNNDAAFKEKKIWQTPGKPLANRFRRAPC